MKNLIFCIFCVASFVMAGKNSSAKLYIDADIGTPLIDSLRLCEKDSTFTVGIKITDVVELYGFQVYMQYDTSKVKLVSVTKGNAIDSNFLETSGRQLIFNGKKSLTDSTQILIAGSLFGDDKSQCSIGAGVLALVTFRMKLADTSKLTLQKSMLLDFDENVDSTLQKFSAQVIPGQSKVIFKRSVASNLKNVNMINGKVHILLPDVSRSEITLVDVKGRVVANRTERSNKILVDLTGSGAGFFILKVAQHGTICAYPLVLK